MKKHIIGFIINLCYTRFMAFSQAWQQIIKKIHPSRKVVIGVLLLIVSVFILIVDIQRSIKQEDPADYAGKLLVLRGRRISELAASIEAASLQFFTNTVLNSTLSEYVADIEHYDISRWNTVFSQHMEGLAQTVPEIKDAIFFAINNSSKIPLMMTDSLMRSLYQPLRTTLMNKAITASGKAIWDVFSVSSEYSAQSPSKFLVCARLISTNNTQQPLGVLVLLISPDRIASAVIGTPWNEGYDTGSKIDHTLLIDENHSVLVSGIHSEIGVKAETIVPGLSEYFLRKSKTEAIGSGKYKTKVREQENAPQKLFWVIYERISERDWMLISVLQAIVNPMTFFFKIFIIICFSISVWLIWSSLVSEKITIYQSVISSSPPEAIPEWFKTLTSREKVLMALLLKGYSNKEIAYRMGIREQTVKNYLHDCYKKLCVQDRLSAMLLMQNSHLSLETIKDYAEQNPSEFLFPIDFLSE